jgi:hypothetical protein
MLRKINRTMFLDKGQWIMSKNIIFVLKGNVYFYCLEAGNFKSAGTVYLGTGNAWTAGAHQCTTVIMQDMPGKG